MKILAVIAARGGSKGIKNKNIRDLAGKPLISYTIAQVMSWGGFERFIVSTDSEKIKEEAIRGGAEVPFLRPCDLATDTAGKVDVLRHALIEAEKHYGVKFDALFDFDATSPVRSAFDIGNMIKIFAENRPDCVFSVVRSKKNPYFNMVEQKEDGTVGLCKEIPQSVKRRQDAPVVFDMNASMYVYDRDFLLAEKSVMPYSGKSMIYEMNELSAFDIDHESDLLFLEFLLERRIVEL